MEKDCTNSQTFEIEESQSGERLDKFLASIYREQSRTFFQKLIKSGNVLVNEREIMKAGATVDFGDIVTVFLPKQQSVEIAAENIPLDILYEDEDVLIVNKPKGMVVHPSAGH